MKKFIMAMFVLLLQLGFSSASHAKFYIVDTGPGPNSLPGLSVGEGYQWLAQEFAISKPFTVTDVSGWLGYGGGILEIAIYSDGGTIPGEKLFSDSVSVPDVNDPEWIGLTGLSWNLDPGNYWVSFGDTSPSGSVSLAAPFPSLNPLETSAIWHPDSGWMDTDSAGNPLDFKIGVQIAAVPEPSTYAMMIMGLAGMGYMRKRKQKG